METKKYRISVVIDQVRGHDDRVSAAGILLMTRPNPDEMPCQFLLMRHADRWDLPKGHSEPGESLCQTALREAEEETGISPSKISLDPDFLFSLTYPVRYPERGDRVFQKTVTYLLGFVERSLEVRCSEHQGFRWFDWKPPHSIQTQTIDPLLDAVAKHLSRIRRRDGRRC